MIRQQLLDRVHNEHPHRIRIDHLNKDEQKIYDALLRGDKVERGPHSVRIETHPGRRSVPWKSIVQRKLGTKVVRRELQNVKPRMYEYLVFD